MPYSVYPEFEFDVPIGDGHWGKLGDSMDRYMVRIREMAESSKILRQALSKIPAGPVLAKVRAQFQAAGRRMPDSPRERARRHGMVRRQRRHRLSVAGARPHRLVRRDGNHPEAEPRDLMIADLVTLIASLDVIAPEIDR